MSRRLEIILGPTAVGKTGYAIRRALEVGSPVISCDSRQIYKELKNLSEAGRGLYPSCDLRLGLPC